MNILSSNTTPLFLPKDIIFDMLSYLPVKSVQRFKCVSQLWNIITQDFRFICLHFKHVRPLINYNKKSEENITTTDEYKLIFSRGLVLEYATRPSHFPCSPNLRYRVRNPELHDQIVEIPDSEKPILNMQMVVDPNNKVLKLLSLVYDELLEDQVLDQVLSYEVLDLQSEGSNYSWRPINLPQHSRGKTRMCKLVKKHTGQIKVIVFTNLGIVYSIWDAEEYSHIGIDILDMVSESYIGHTTLPTCFYTKDDCKLWNGKLSFAKIVKDEVHVLILESYNKKHMKWADGKLIIKLPFLKDVSVEPVIKLLYLSNTNKLFFVWRDKESIHSFDIKTGKLTIILSNYKLSQGLYLSWPGLFTFKGLQSSSGQ
ncbi:hypothetical protein KY284_002948 [Solanum tuberosum]|nr:hypothetical protein KY284_002948 [Solanum tuberosum]